MAVFSIQNQKGGVGKTTLAIHISHALSLAKVPVLLIDADPQGSARDWGTARADKPPFDLLGLDRPTIHRDLPSIGANYAHIVIDGPPRVTDLARSAIAAADVVIIPIQPSPYDVWAAQEVVTLIHESEVFKPNLKSVFAINRKIVNTAIGRDVTEALSGYELPVLKAHLSQRVIFAESAATGQTVLELEPKGAASREVKTMVKELMTYAE